MKNDSRKWLAIILIPAILFLLIFCWIDNPAAHSGRPVLNYIGENSEEHLIFNLHSGNPYHIQYAGDYVRVKILDHQSGQEYNTHIKLSRESRYDQRVVVKQLYQENRNNSGSVIVVTSSPASLPRGSSCSIRIMGEHRGILFKRSAKEACLDFIIQ